MTELRTIRGRYGSGAGQTDDIRIDGSTETLMQLNYEHHEIHSGSMFHAEANAAGGSGTKATITFKTPNSNKWAHVLFTARSNAASVMTIGEAATVTAASGTNYAPKNKNRNHATASVLIAEGSAGGAGNVTTGATVTSFGTELTSVQMGAGVKEGGETRGTGEWVLRANTVYAFEVESQAASSEVNVELTWYEHTERNYPTPTPTPTPTLTPTPTPTPT